MKILLCLAILAVLTACGKDKDSVNPPSPIDPDPVVQNESILNKFTAVTVGLHGINELDYSQVTLGVPTQDTNCTGSYGNVGLVNGVDRGFSLMSGTESEGTLQFGHLAYVGISNPALYNACRSISKESYTYKITGDVLKLCMVNYPFCADYKVVK